MLKAALRRSLKAAFAFKLPTNFDFAYIVFTYATNRVSYENTAIYLELFAQHAIHIHSTLVLKSLQSGLTVPDAVYTNL